MNLPNNFSQDFTYLIIFLTVMNMQEKELCDEIRILPSHYLNMLQIMTDEISKGSMSKKSDAYILFNVEPSKVDRVYDMLVKKGVAPT